MAKGKKNFKIKMIYNSLYNQRKKKENLDIYEF